MAEILTDGRDIRLEKYLEQAMNKPWVWGKTDCGMWVSDWIANERKIDPGSIWRGEYSNGLGCHNLVQKCGGYVKMISDRMRLLGFETTTNPAVGDVGMVRGIAAYEPNKTFFGVVCSIYDGSRWVVRTHHGFAAGHYDMQIAWMV